MMGGDSIRGIHRNVMFLPYQRKKHNKIVISNSLRNNTVRNNTKLNKQSPERQKAPGKENDREQDRKVHLCEARIRP